MRYGSNYRTSLERRATPLAHMRDVEKQRNNARLNPVYNRCGSGHEAKVEDEGEEEEKRRLPSVIHPTT